MEGYKTKDGRPLCRYCRKKLTEGKRLVRTVNVSKIGGTDLRNIYEPSGEYGRHGRGVFCTQTCAEEWAMLQITGRSVRRGKSHDPVERGRELRVTTLDPKSLRQAVEKVQREHRVNRGPDALAILEEITIQRPDALSVLEELDRDLVVVPRKAE